MASSTFGFKQPYANLYDHKELGSGHFGITFSSLMKRPNQAPLRVVCKVSKNRPGQTEWREAQNLASLSPHPLVVKLLGICFDWRGKDVALLFEYHSGGTLEDYIRGKHESEGGGVDNAEMLKLAYAMATSIRHIHANGVLHRDIAPRNFVLSDDGLPVLIDFGLSRKDLEYRSVGGKPIPWRIMPLETLDSKQLLSRPASDVYMLGITFWQLYNGCIEPFAHIRNSEQLRNELMDALELDHTASARLHYLKDTPQPMIDLIKRMCSIDAELRPTIEEVCDALKLHVHEDLAKFDIEPHASEDDGRKLTDLDGIFEEYMHANEIIGDSSTSKKELLVQHISIADVQTHREDEVKSSEVEDVETPTHRPRAKQSTSATSHVTELSYTERTKELLIELSGIGLNDKRGAVITLRNNDVDRRNLLSLDKDDLAAIFPERGTVARILAFKKKYLPTALHVAASENDIDKMDVLLRRKTLRRNLPNTLGDTEFHVAVKSGSALAVTALLENKRTDVGLRCALSSGEQGATVFHVAAENNHANVLALLLASTRSKLPKFDTAMPNGTTALDIAKRKGNLQCEQLLREGVKTSMQSTQFLSKPFKNNVYFKTLSFFRKRLIDGSESKLHHAAYYNNLNVARKLISSGFDANCRNKDYKTALHYGASRDSHQVIELLLSIDGVKVNAEDFDGDTPLHLAANHDSAMVAKQLISHKEVNIAAQNTHKWTPLHYAADRNSHRVAALLLEVPGTNKNAQNDDGETPLHRAAYNDNVMVAKLLISNEEVNKDARDNQIWTPLHRAASRSSHKVAKLLLDAPVVDKNARDNDGKTPLRVAVDDGRTAITKLLISHKDVDRNTKDKLGCTLLHVAAQKDDIKLLNLVLQSGEVDVGGISNDSVKVTQHLIQVDGVNVNAEDEDGDTPLHVAALNNSSKVVELLFAYKQTNCGARNNIQWTPLHCAASNDSVEVAKLLLELDGVDVNAEDEDGSTPLHTAAECASSKVTELLLAHKQIKRDARDNTQQTPFHYAAANDSVEVAKLLLEVDGVDVNAEDEDGSSPLHVAALNNSYKVTELLLAHKQTKCDARDNTQYTPLHCAASNDSVEAAKLLLEVDGVDVNDKDEDGSSPLHIAASNDSVEVAKVLLEVDGVDVNAEGKDGNTPLHIAALNNSSHVTELLLALNQIECHTRANDQWTPLHFAAASDCIEVALQLLEVDGVDVNAKDTDGWSPLHIAALLNSSKVTELLLAHKQIKRDARDNTQYTPLHYAAANDSVEVAKLLLEVDGVNANVEGAHGNNPLHIAAQNNSSKVTEPLLARKQVQFEARGIFQRTPLHNAALWDCLEVAKMLLQVDGVDVNAEDEDYNTPLHIAAMHNSQYVAELLLTHKQVKCDARNKDQWTPLHCAASKESVDVAKLQLQVDGVDVNAEDKDGHTPLHIAYKHIKRDLRDEGKGTPLHCKASDDSAEVKKISLQINGVNVVVVVNNKDGKTPLACAANTDGPTVAELLTLNILRLL